MTLWWTMNWALHWNEGNIKIIFNAHHANVDIKKGQNNILIALWRKNNEIRISLHVKIIIWNSKGKICNYPFLKYIWIGYLNLSDIHLSCIFRKKLYAFYGSTFLLLGKIIQLVFLKSHLLKKGETLLEIVFNYMIVMFLLA